MHKNMTTEKILLAFDPEVSNLLPALKEIDAAFGYVSEKDARKAADYFELPLAQVYETASFYDGIRTEKPANLTIQVCSGGDCTLGGSAAVVREIENYFHIKAGDQLHPHVRLEVISCLGRCYEGPIMIVNGKAYEKMTPSGIHRIMEEYRHNF